MSLNALMSRRRFISLVSLSLLSSPLNLSAQVGSYEIDLDMYRKKIEYFLDQLKFKQYATNIGIIFLDKYPQYSNISLLINSTFPMHINKTIPEFIQALKQQISNDFKMDNIVNINGWILSKSEAQLYALCALTEKDLNNAV